MIKYKPIKKYLESFFIDNTRLIKTQLLEVIDDREARQSIQSLDSDKSESETEPLYHHLFTKSITTAISSDIELSDDQIKKNTKITVLTDIGDRPLKIHNI